MFNGSEIAYLSYKRLPSPVDIRLGDDTSVRVTHHGTLLVQRQEIDALHLPTFRYPLLSAHRLARQGHTITATDQDCIILDKQSIITMTGRSNGNLYQLDSETQALAADASLRDADIQDVPMPDAPMALLGSTAYTPKLSITESTLWHRRLGHLHIAAMKSLVDGYTHDGSICEICIQAKHERKIIRIPVQRTTAPFELVHSDTCGPFATKSVGGASHFIVFIDDYTRYTGDMESTTSSSDRYSRQEVYALNRHRHTRSTRTASRSV